MASDASSETLEFTPTCVVAAVCTVIVVISLCAERILYYLGKFLEHKRQDALFEALQKLKEELMLLGFISLLLTVFQSLISQICITKSVTSRMLPCEEEGSNHVQVILHGKELFTGRVWNRRRLLSGNDGLNICTSQMPYLDEWTMLEGDPSSSLSGATKAVQDALLRLPITGNVRADIRELKEVLNSATDMLEFSSPCVQRFIIKMREFYGAEGIEDVISDLARLVCTERTLLEECGNLLSEAHKLQVKECSLRSQLIQAKQSSSM